MSCRKWSLLAVNAIAAATASRSYSGTDEIPPSFRRDVQCMIDVLRSTPRVDQVQSGTLLDDGWAHPFVQYHYQEQDGRAGEVRFVARKSSASKDAVEYLAHLNGLFAPGGTLPPNLGTAEIAMQWKVRCGVTATAVHE